MRDGQVASPPYGARSSAGVTTDGTLDIRRISFFGTWQGAGVKRTLNTLQRKPPANGIALFTQAWGATTPAVPGATAVILFPFPAAVPNADLAGAGRRGRSGGAPVPIPIGGAVLVARRAAAAALAAEAPVGQQVTTRSHLQAGLAGRRLRDRRRASDRAQRRAVFRAGEAFTTAQLGRGRRAPASASSPTGGSSSSPSTAASPGTSVGMTNFELAQALVRLGAVTAMALDGGGSTTMAFDGTLLNRPSDGRSGRSRRRCCSCTPACSCSPPSPSSRPTATASPTGRASATRLVRPSTTTVTLTAPDGSRRLHGDGRASAGQLQPPVPAADRRRRRAVPVTPSQRGGATRRPRTAAGSSSVSAVDDIGQPSEMTQSFTVNTTLGYLGTVPKKLFLPPLGRDVSDHLEAGPGGARRRHRRDAGRRGRANPRQAVATRPAPPGSSGTVSTASGSRSRAAGTSIRVTRRTRSGRSSSRATSAFSGSSGRSRLAAPQSRVAPSCSSPSSAASPTPSRARSATTASTPSSS